MKYNVSKNGMSINFVDSITGEKFDYVKFADSLYNGEKLEIKNFSSNLTEEEKKTILQTVKELNSLSNPRKRKKIIAQLDSDN